MGNEPSKTTSDGGVSTEEHKEKVNVISRMDNLVRSRVRGNTAYDMKVVIRGAKGS